MASPAAAIGNQQAEQQPAPDEVPEQPEWLKSQLRVVFEYHENQRQMMAEMQAAIMVKSVLDVSHNTNNTVKRKQKQRAHPSDPIKVRRSHRRRQRSIRTCSPFVVSIVRKTRKVAQKGHNVSENFGNAEITSPKQASVKVPCEKRNVNRLVKLASRHKSKNKVIVKKSKQQQRLANIQPSLLRRSKRQRRTSQRTRSPYIPVQLYKRKKRSATDNKAKRNLTNVDTEAISPEHVEPVNVSDASGGQKTIIELINCHNALEPDASNVTVTSCNQVPTSNVQQHIKIINTPVTNLVTGSRIVRFVNCTTTSPQLRIQCADKKEQEHVYCLKQSHWSTAFSFFCTTCGKAAFVTFVASGMLLDSFRIREGGQHRRECAQLYEQGLPHHKVRIIKDQLFVKASHAVVSDNKDTLTVKHHSSELTFLYNGGSTIFDRYVMGCACRIPAIVTTAGVWISWAHGESCPMWRRMQVEDDSAVKENNVVPIKPPKPYASVKRSPPTAVKVSRPKTVFPMDAVSRSAISGIPEDELQPPVNEMATEVAVSNAVTLEPESVCMLSPADIQTIQECLTATSDSPCSQPVDCNRTDSPFIDSGISSADSSRRTSFGAAGLIARRASEPAARTINLPMEADYNGAYAFTYRRASFSPSSTFFNRTNRPVLPSTIDAIHRKLAYHKRLREVAKLMVEPMGLYRYSEEHGWMAVESSSNDQPSEST